MTKRAAFVAVAALLTLSGCERLGIGAGAGNDSNASASASGGKDIPTGNNQLAFTDPAPPAGGKDPNGGAIQAVSNGGGAPTLDRAFIVGRWSDRGDCTDWVEFASDGSFTSWDNVTGIWNLRDDRLTVTGARTISFEVEVVDQNTLTAINQAGETGRSTRC